MTVAPVAQDPVLVEPYCTVAGFRAHPTFIETTNLITGGNQAAQDAELFNILLMASEDANNFCNRPLQAHVQTDYGRLNVDRRGRLFLYPDHVPVRTLLSYSYSSILGQFTSVANPICQIEDGRQIIVELAGASSSWSGRLQFGAPPSSVELYCTWTYVAGWTNATLTAAPGQGATSITVSNPIGIYPGDTLRIWEPGKEETVTVASNYVPVTTRTPTAVGCSATSFAHAIGHGVSGMTANLIQASICYAIDGIQRWGPTSAQWPGTRMRRAIGKNPAESATNWESKAQRLLLTYRDVR